MLSWCKRTMMKQYKKYPEGMTAKKPTGWHPLQELYPTPELLRQPLPILQHAIPHGTDLHLEIGGMTMCCSRHLAEMWERQGGCVFHFH